MALNYQTKSDEMTLYRAKFRQNGNCGYVLKPEYMRSINHDIKKPIIRDEVKQILIISVLSGSQIPVSSHTEENTLSVEICITGDPRDGAKEQTKEIKSEGD